MNNTRNRTTLLRIALNHSLRFLPAILLALLTKSQGTAQPDAQLMRLASRDEMLPGIRKEPGVVVMYAVNSKQDPTNVSILEVYSNRIAYEKHLTTSHYLKYKGRSNDMIKTVEFIDVRPILLGSKMSD